MDKRIILATAGSGKTFHLCHELNSTKRNIIIAYTHQNIRNILKELYENFGKVPDNTLVMTFHSFIYKFMIRPFDKMIGNYYGVENFKSKGVTIVTPPKSYIPMKNGGKMSNPQYNSIDSLEHYKKDKYYYSDYLSKLIIKTKNKDFSLIKESCNNINKFYDCIYVDEVQDFREYNWKLLVEIIKRVNNILMVGDYNQHSVSATNNSGMPFKNNKIIVGYEDYIEYLKKLGIIVDNTTLIKSRKCSKEVCEFIKTKLNIKIESSGKNTGKVNLITESDKIKEILSNNKIVKMVWDNAEQYNFNAISWSYSKGDTYKETCVILTDVYSNLMENNYINMEPSISKNKLYVALTRSSGNVNIVNKQNLIKAIHTE